MQTQTLTLTLILTPHRYDFEVSLMHRYNLVHLLELDTLLLLWGEGGAAVLVPVTFGAESTIGAAAVAVAIVVAIVVVMG